MPARLPQGSFLSPILWTAFTSDLRTPPNRDTGYYADDTAIIAAAKQSNKVIGPLATALVENKKKL